MEKDVEKFEKLIRETILFDISKDQEPNKYDRERCKLIEYLYSYLISQNEEENIEYGLEIVDVAKRCINNFDRTKGVFLHYFNKAWMIEKGHLFGKTKAENDYHGVKFSENNKRIIKKYLKYKFKYDEISDVKEFYKIMSETLKITIEETLEIAKMAATQFKNNEKTDEEGHVTNELNEIPMPFSCIDMLEDKNNVETLLGNIEKLYEDLQDRQKPIVSDMMTCDLVDELISFSDTLLGYSFINKEILKNVKNTGEKPSQRDIAKKHNKNEASISRTMREFKGKLKEKLKR